MNFLFSYDYSLKLFIEYCNNKKYPIKSIIQTKDFKLQLGYLLEFLDFMDTFCIVDSYNVIVYTTNESYVKKHKQLYIIKETDNAEYKSVMSNYEYAITKAFEFLNVPF